MDPLCGCVHNNSSSSSSSSNKAALVHWQCNRFVLRTYQKNQQPTTSSTITRRPAQPSYSHGALRLSYILCPVLAALQHSRQRAVKTTHACRHRRSVAAAISSYSTLVLSSVGDKISFYDNQNPKVLPLQCACMYGTCYTSLGGATPSTCTTTTMRYMRSSSLLIKSSHSIQRSAMVRISPLTAYLLRWSSGTRHNDAPLSASF